ncbi:hypothetical protein EGJ05_06615 [Stutzerimonas xanthomarina]|nr:hypothetical protein EGJ05_06615 [Stutzerimonas xanthomarina]
MNSSSIRVAGKSEQLGKKLGKGGEGDVFALAGRPDRAVKIYKAELRTSREGKVRAMVEGRLAESTGLVAFPFDVVTDSSGVFAGFSMRLVAGYRPLHELYSPKSRKIHFPKADYRFLVRVAQNVARAVATVHQAGCVIGDLNHSGVLVSQDATVALIDADSFQFSMNDHLYPCVVGTEDFTPPELHGISLSTVTRTLAHDHFGLAVAIFQLLVMGKHPYAGRFAGPDLSLGQAIAQNRFAFSVKRRDETRTTPPPGSVLLEDLPPPIASAFETAFGLNAAARPTPSVWVGLLQGLETNLRKCSTVASHYFPNSAGSCLWCRLASQSGVEMFPLGLSRDGIPTVGPFNFDRIWAAIQAVRLPLVEDVLPTWSGDVGPPSATLNQEQRRDSDRYVIGVFAIIGAIIGFAAVPFAAFLWVCLGIYGFIKLLSNPKLDTSPFIKAYKDADHKVVLASQAYLQRIGLKEIYALRADMEELATRYRQIDQDLGHALIKLKATREARQRTEFLDRFPIRRAKIPGIGPAKTATLASFGIETAADVTKASILAVPGFGEALTGKMLAWRQTHEVKFRYNPFPEPSDLQAENAVRSALATKKIDIQNKLQSGLAALQAAAPRFVSPQSPPDKALMRALAERAEAQRDCAILGIALPAPAAVTIVLPKKITAQTSRSATPSLSKNTLAGVSGSSSSIRCPSCGASMVRRTARKGRNAGKQFWGCSKYPACKGTRN